MDERIRQLLASVPPETLALVASRVLGMPVVAVDGLPALTEITTPHAEQRTVAIVKVSGTAQGRMWSSVVKVVDLSVEAASRLAGSTAPETEEIFYEEGYFADRPSGLRPARCYLISRPAQQLKFMWLEDLTGAGAAPFSFDQLREMSRQFGSWNGENVSGTPAFAFPLLRETFVARYRTWDFPTKLRQLSAMWDAPYVRDMYRDRPIAAAADFLALMPAVIERCRAMPVTLAYGDCSEGNLFFLDGRVVGIDWASLTLEPTGVDAGCLIGSAITWGRHFAAVAPRERELFDCYVEGLRSAGWSADVNEVRLAYFCQFGFYLSASLMLPVNLSGTDNFLAASFFEKRYGMPVGEIPKYAAALVDLAPSLTAEIRSLLS